MLKNSRNEIKFLITKADAIDLYNKLRCVMTTDIHATDNNEYFIRSLYYDDQYASAYTTKIDGDNNRQKYRIRIYNMSDDTISFERKLKRNNKVNKISFNMKRYQYEQLMADNYHVLNEIDHPLASEILGLHNSVGLKPTVVVDYYRTALLHPLSNTRITFDKHLRAGINSYDVFDEDLYTYPIFPQDSVILEVKYDKVIPAHISAILGTIYGHKMALSKFCLCRSKLSQMNIKNSIIY